MPELRTRFEFAPVFSWDAAWSTLLSFLWYYLAILQVIPMEAFPRPIEELPSPQRTSGDDVKQGDFNALPEDTTTETPKKFRPDKRFWLVMISLMSSTFLSALDLSVISIALPTIAVDLNGASSFLWVGSAYALTSTALVPWSGSLAGIFGRKPSLLVAIALFAAGSAMCGAAKSMSVMIAGRSVQGIGGGAILVLTQIVIVDLVPLASRGPFMGMLGSIWALATTCGPPISGALTGAGPGKWRYIFYMQVPLAVIAFVLVSLFMDVKKPNTTWQEKFALMDWYNFIFVAASTSMVIGLSWAGVTYSWSSVQVLAPLVLGIVGIIFFLWVEKFSSNPTVPFAILAHPTSRIGFFETFLQSLVMMAVVYYLPPAYFQAAKLQSPIMSGVDSLPLSFIVAPFAVIAGITVAKTQKYKVINVAGWVFILVGLGLFSLLQPHTPVYGWILIPIVGSIGLGLLQSGTAFPVQAPLPPNLQPSALAFNNFVRSFGQVLGITIGGTVLNNALVKNLPEAFVSQFPQGEELTFVAIPILKHLSNPLLGEVQQAFADALRTIFYVMIGISGLGFIASLFMKDLAMSKVTDEQWGLAEREKKVLAEEAKEVV